MKATILRRMSLPGRPSTIGFIGIKEIDNVPMVGDFVDGQKVVGSRYSDGKLEIVLEWKPKNDK